jgi:hypothetical protein
MNTSKSCDESIEWEEVVTVTPQMAREWIDKHGNPLNRLGRINLGRARALSELMAAGRWEISGEFAISFGRGGILINGHHRLHAVILHGRPVTFVVRRNVDMDALKYIDVVQTRTRAQVGHMFGIDTSNDDALRLIHMTQPSATQFVSDLRLESLRNQLKDSIALVHAFADVKYKKRRLRGGVRAGLIVLARVRGEAAVGFFKTIGPVCNRSTVEPRAIVNLVRWMDNHSSAGIAFQMEHLAVTLNAYEQYVSGVHLRQLRSDGLHTDGSAARRLLSELALT